MNIIIVMIPLSLLILIGAAVAFFWAVNHDQFDDMDSPGLLPMSDDPTPDPEPRRQRHGAPREQTK
jgi:cbb3-type cytochrome oxidase maturation protein